MELKQKVIISIAPTIIALLALSYSLYASSSVNRNILYITQPVNSLTGKVTKVNGKWITVEKTMRESAQKPVSHAFFRIETTDATRYEQQQYPLDYEAKTGIPLMMTKRSVSDIRVNDIVTVSTATDLRTLHSETFTADTIMLPPANRILSGQLITKGPDTLIIRSSPKILTQQEQASVQPETMPEPKDYRIALVHQTKIIKNITPSDPMAPVTSGITTWEELPLNTAVNIYTDKPVTDGSLSALYIDFMQHAALAAAPSSTPSAELKPATPVITPGFTVTP